MGAWDGKRAGRAVLLALGYGVVLRWSLGLLVEPETVAVIWPPSGYLLAWLLLSPAGWWRGIAGLAVPVHVAVNMAVGRSFGVAVGYALANGIEALMAAWLLRRLAPERIALDRVRHVMSLAAVGLAAGAVSATVGAAVTVWGGAQAAFVEVWRVWMVAVVIGITVVAPVPLTLARAEPRDRELPRLLETVLLFGGLTAVVVALFGTAGESGRTALPLMFVPFPFLLWAAVRFGPVETALAALLLALGSVWGTALGMGPMVALPGDIAERVLWLQVYLAVGVLSAQALAALMSEARSSSRALRESEARFRSLVEQAADGIFIADAAAQVVDVNPSACAMLGYAREELIGRSLLDLMPREDLQRDPPRLDLLESGDTVVRERRLRRRDGQLVPVEISAKRFGQHLIGIVRDVTGRKQLEKQLLQAQKMEGIGRLAGGVAHDFNNLLTAIVGYAEMTADALPPGDPKRANIEQVLVAAHRATDLTRQLLTFARRRPHEASLVRVDTLLANLDKMLRRLIGEDIELTTRLQPQLDPVRCDAGLLEQVIVNLVVNARDAMPSGGRLAIEAFAVELASEDAADLQLPLGRHVAISVEDTGSGMDSAVLAHVFEPFFTTKEVGKGTGLGLATCYGIVSQAGGAIVVRSKPGEGSRFLVYLPAATELDEPQTVESAPSSVASGGEAVLVVEDDAAVRSLAVEALRERGYRVLQASCGQEALEIASRTDHPIDLLLTDVVMPRLSGRQLADRLLALRAETKVLLMSGYTDHPSLPSADGEERELLRKPFTRDELAQRVREVLDRRAARALHGS